MVQTDTQRWPSTKLWSAHVRATAKDNTAQNRDKGHILSLRTEIKIPDHAENRTRAVGLEDSDSTHNAPQPTNLIFLFLFFLRNYYLTSPMQDFQPPGDLQSKCPWVKCLQGEHGYWTRKPDKHTRAPPPEFVVSRTSGPPTETTQDRTQKKDKHQDPGQK